MIIVFVLTFVKIIKAVAHFVYIPLTIVHAQTTNLYPKSAVHSPCFALVVMILTLVMIVTPLTHRVHYFGAPFLLVGVLIMAKGGYMCIGYEDSMVDTPDFIVECASLVGAETCYIFHDLDGVEPHFHFIFMWRKAVLQWSDDHCKTCEQSCSRDCRFYNFISFMKEMGLKAPKKGTSIVYDYNTAVIKDIDAALDYMVHEHET